ncbi:uncharacterized protein FIBRA_08334 [Fibroporia radiculosa]|uniref:F-box domain-containing protein n=1 Tax=Fibroporia radiculosa TaxID=599839 RepID=J4I2K1_9APHY|nr:uncharacterized protein FIBRA_08334 [Fibroporia radiculosa]CCM06087.1 predicted protein [Fibroporia radiculosa]
MAIPPTSAYLSTSGHEGISQDEPGEPDLVSEDGRGMRSFDITREAAIVSAEPRHPHFETPTEMSIQLPVEIWERIIDHLGERFDPGEDMWTYGLVCRAWYHRTRFHALRHVSLTSKKAAYSLVKMMERNAYFRSAVRRISIHDNIDVLGTISACLARRLPKADALRIYSCEWSPGRLHPHIFMHIRATFETVTSVFLADVAFPTTAVFGRLICSLPQLSAFTCMNVTFKRPGFRPGFISPMGRPSLTSLNILNGEDDDSREHAAIKDILEFVVSASMVTHLRHIGLFGCESLNPSVSQRLVDSAAASLLSIYVVSAPLSSTSPDFLTLDFSAAINLETLTLWLDDCHLERAAECLARALPSKLREVKVVRFVDEAEDDLIDKLFDDHHVAAYTRIDQLLSGPQYKVLNEVSFELVIDVDASDMDEIPSERIWHELFSPRLPRLRERGVLQTAVIIDSRSNMFLPDVM